MKWTTANGWAALLGALLMTANAGVARGQEPSADEVESLRQRLDQYERELDWLREQVGNPQVTRLPKASFASENSVSGLEERVSALEAGSHQADGEDDGCKKVDIQTKPNHKLRGRIYLDHLMFDDDPVLGDRENETGFDTARIGIEGNVYETLKYKFEVEFEGEETDFKDAYLEATHLPGVGHFLGGHFKEPYGLEELVSSRFDTFMEQSSATATFAPSRNIGFMAHNQLEGNENIAWFLGTFRNDSTDNPTEDIGTGALVRDDDGDWTFATRAAWLPYYDEFSEGRYLVHVGFDWTYRHTGDDQIAFVTDPVLGTQGSNIAAFGPVGDQDWHQIAVETAVNWGPLGAQAEYFAADTGAFDFDGAYVQVTYFLTGEHRGYKRSAMAFDRVDVLEPFFHVRTADGVCTGKGAWELKARYSYVDLRSGVREVDEADLRGEGNNFVVGLNWYLTSYSRVMFDYVHENVERLAGIEGERDSFGLRWQIDW